MMSNIFRRTFFLAAFTLFCFGSAIAQTNDEAEVIATLEDYLIGSSFNDPERIKSAFYTEAEMFLDHPERPIFLMKPERYAQGFARREKGVFNGRYGTILNIDIEGNIATAKAEILLPARNSRYIDFFLLKKLDGEWKIISKSAGRADSALTGERLLLIASGKTRRHDFSDVISDHKAAIEAGFSVTFVSETGGAILFKNIDMRKQDHRDYLHNDDFMFAVAHSVAARMIKPEDYASAQYLYDRHDRKRKSGHADVDALYTKICEEEAVCRR